jgi:F-type H+-transporting ATPase subunit epsilon
MPDKTFKLEVITPDKIVLSEKSVTSVMAPGVEGYFGVLANHAPFMTELAIGELDYAKADGTKNELAIAGGFMEVKDNTVSVLADIAELKEEIDLERAQRSLQRAEERVASPPPDIDLERARLALMKALNRVRVASKNR